MTEEILSKARKIKLLITDCDGVLTDGGVYYGEQGEVLKKFNVRDGMGVERLRKLADVTNGNYYRRSFSFGGKKSRKTPNNGIAFRNQR